jgi:hypothetical protein
MRTAKLVLVAAIIALPWKVFTPAHIRTMMDGSPQGKFDAAVAIVERYEDDSPDIRVPPPAVIVLVHNGQVIDGRCTERETDASFDYCSANDTIYAGEAKLKAQSKTEVEFGLGHEYGHHVELMIGMYKHRPRQEVLENRADCVGGAISAYAVRTGFRSGSQDVSQRVGFDPDAISTHGSDAERRSWIQKGASKGITACFDT